MSPSSNGSPLLRGGPEIVHRGVFSETNPARLILVDDHAILREGLIALSNMEVDLKVVGQAATIAEGLLVAQSMQPDLITY